MTESPRSHQAQQHEEMQRPSRSPLSVLSVDEQQLRANSSLPSSSSLLTSPAASTDASGNKENYELGEKRRATEAPSASAGAVSKKPRSSSAVLLSAAFAAPQPRRSSSLLLPRPAASASPPPASDSIPVDSLLCTESLSPELLLPAASPAGGGSAGFSSSSVSYSELLDKAYALSCLHSADAMWMANARDWMTAMAEHNAQLQQRITDLRAELASAADRQARHDRSDTEAAAGAGDHRLHAYLHHMDRVQESRRQSSRLQSEQMAAFFTLFEQRMADKERQLLRVQAERDEARTALRDMQRDRQHQQPAVDADHRSD